MRILVATSDPYVHLLPGFAYLWNKYCGLPVTVIYRNVPPPQLPSNFETTGSPAAERDWSTMMINALERISDRIVLLGLDDFWVSDVVNRKALDDARWYMIHHPDVQRIDLTEDRAGFPHMERDGYLQAVIDPAQLEYVCSTQWSLWRRDFLLTYLRPGEMSPQFEVEGSKRAAPFNPVILGTGDRPIPGSGDGIIHNGRLDNPRVDYLKPEDVSELKRRGYL